MTVVLMQGSDDVGAPATEKQKNSVSVDLETIRVQTVALMQKLSEKASLDTLRPLHVFLGVTAPSFCLAAGAFSPPVHHVDKSFVEKVKARLTLNLNYFFTNYALVVMGVAVVVSLLHPGMLLVCGMVWGLWSLHFFLIHNELTLFGTNLRSIMTISQRSKVLTFLTIFSIVWKCFMPVLSFLAVSGFIIVGHALLRDPKHVQHPNDTQSDAEDDKSEEEVLVEKGDVI